MGAPRIRYDIRAGVFLFCGADVLCVKERWSNLWGAPKGKQYPWECAWETGGRELKEETDVDLGRCVLNRTTRRIRVQCENYWARGLTTVHVYCVVQLKEKPRVTIQESEIKEFKWMTIEELSKQKVSFLTRKAIRAITDTTK
jgi:ADP-ribose pyrophosphatase YjhB (NUDIX family)